MIFPTTKSTSVILYGVVQIRKCLELIVSLVDLRFRGTRIVPSFLLRRSIYSFVIDIFFPFVCVKKLPHSLVSINVVPWEPAEG